MVEIADFKVQLGQSKKEIDEALAEVFAQADVSMFSQHGKQAWAMLEEFSSRPGKRIRGSLVLTAYEMYGGQNREQALKAAAAIELVQNYLLLIDDVMDRSATRRGKPTAQYLYYEQFKDMTVDDIHHLGDMLAINLGLVASHVASQLMNELEEEPARVVRANRVFHTNIKATTFGQIDDLFSAVDRADEADVLLTHKLKSSYYTFINPMQVGAILAGANDADCEQIEAFGIPAGVAFQLQDDIIGLFGAQDTTGKSNLDDLSEGKFTLIMQQTLERADERQAELVESALGNHQVTQQQAEAVREIAMSNGAKQYADKLAKDFARQATEVVVASEWPELQKQFLTDLMGYIIERLK